MKHFINLTNGLEWLYELRGTPFSFIRIQSSHVERKDYDKIMAQLDSNFLLMLAAGETCIVYDCSSSERKPKSLKLGVSYIEYILNKIWLNKEIVFERGYHHYFKTVKLSRPVAQKIKYFKKFLNTQCITIPVKFKQTLNDGNYSYFDNLLKLYVEDEIQKESILKELILRR